MITELQIGDRIKDNDPRMKYRGPLTIVGITPEHVKATPSAGPLVRILKTRIYTDGKPRKNGFSRIQS